jgi:hypothetical protein
MKPYLSICLTCLAARIAVAAEVNVPETWPDASLQDWVCVDQSVGIAGTNELSVAGGALRLEPATGAGLIWSYIADSAASGGRFVGSHYALGTHTVALDLTASCAAVMRIELINETGFVSYIASVPVSPGDTAVSVPVDGDHFQRDRFAMGSFEDLLRNVEKVWVTFEWDSAADSPVFAIDNVQLLGAGAGYGEWIDGFADLSFEQRLAGADSDADGIANADEFNMDSLPDTPSAPFTVACCGEMLQWDSSANCQYTVLRSTNLCGQGFTEIRAMPGSGGTMNFEDPDGPDRAFYKITAGRN